MTTEAWIMLAILVVMFAMLVATKLPAWVIFLGTLTVTMTLGLAPETELLKGFSNPGVITIGVLFVVAAGMYSTGAVTIIADKLVGVPKTLLQAQLRLLAPIAMGSAFLNNTPLVAMTVPVIRDLGRTARLAVSKLYIPLSFASILGGASTLIGTSTNLIIAGLVAEALESANPAVGVSENLNIFFPTAIGAPAAIVGIAFIILFGTRLLPKSDRVEEEEVEKRLYRAEFILEEKSYLVGQSIKQAGFAYPEGYELRSVERDDGSLPGIDPELVLQTGDVLTFTVDTDAMPDLWSRIGLTPHISPTEMDTERYRHQLVEVVTSPTNPAVGHTVSELPVREDLTYGVSLVAISRNGKPPEGPIMEHRIAAGDNGVLEVDDSFFYENRLETDYLITKRLRGYRIKRLDKAITASIIVLLMVLAAAFGWLSMLNAALLATFLLLITGSLGLRTAARSVEWDTLLVLAVAIGLESAITATGLSDAIANLLGGLAGDNPYIALAVVFVGCIVMTNLITNAAAAAFMFPISLAIAADLGVSFAPFIVILMLGTSYAFINPAGYQTNMMVYEPGGYEFVDFAKVGLPLTIIAGAVVIFLAPLVYPF